METDYISRQKVERFIENGLNNPDKKKAFGHDAVEILTEVHYMEPADVRPVVRGKWMVDFADNGWIDHTCSVCGWAKNTDIHVRLGYNFCPNCGADMRKEDTP